MPLFSIYIETKYKDDNGCSENVLGLSEEELEDREVEHIDIAYDDMADKHYKESEDPTLFVSRKTGRGQLKKEWKVSWCEFIERR
ncbi:Cytoplasmic phosphatidylinositol transfer protein 1 [Mizuhopecten yessoensis]|uniref:Cytoplasmic phosphatidylinositol transfer protein 1 n=1 Tax=Mizuhopecten yessoensis TaxID=6573 RepID=A0A210PHX0_MIZYE|nr:Cytoplasmic phosphatidylinositol transfer protein 1 [Mizuhopecten yessoensis]